MFTKLFTFVYKSDMNQVRLTTDDFILAVGKTRLKERTKAAARLVLVEGFSCSQAGLKLRPTMSRAAVSKAVNKVLGEFKRHRNCNYGYEVVTVCVPASVAFEIREMEKKYRK